MYEVTRTALLVALACAVGVSAVRMPLPVQTVRELPVQVAPRVPLNAQAHAVEANATDLRFLVLGDWGGLPIWPYITPRELNIAKEMGKIAESEQTQFTVALGDNFYFTGVKDVSSPRFKETYENVFKSPALQSRWYVLAGNHDHYGNVSAEIAYTKQSPRWYYPSEYYTETVPIPGSNQTVQFLFLDTIVLVGQSDDRVHGVIKSHTHPEDIAAANAQLAWIESTLAASTADWIIVAGHYPVYSVAEHGPTAYLVDNLRPLLEKYKVAAYMNGHDHSMQHIAPANDMCDYFVIGAANFAEDSKKHEKDVPAGSEKFFWPPHILDGYGAFASIQLNATTLSVSYIQTGGNVLYSMSKSNPRATGRPL